MLKSLPSCAWKFSGSMTDTWSFPVGTRGKEPTHNAGGHGLTLHRGRPPGAGHGKLTQYFLPGEPHGWGNRAKQSIGLQWGTMHQRLSTHVWLASMIGELYLDGKNLPVKTNPQQKNTRLFISTSVSSLYPFSLGGAFLGAFGFPPSCKLHIMCPFALLESILWNQNFVLFCALQWTACHFSRATLYCSNLL